MLRLFLVVLRAALGAFRARADLVIENIALRQQLAVFKQKHPRPSLSDFDRIFWVLLQRLWSRWIDTLIVVKPETVVRWHREGFRRYWRWKSRRGGRPRTRSQIRQLIRRMATENA